MNSAMPSYLTSDTARERELYRYYQPSNAPHYAVDSDPESAGRTDVPQSSRDTVLTAFAQLACLRLNAKRAMISLVDRDCEHIVAEATQTLSLQSDDSHVKGDSMLAGNRTIHRSEGMASFAVDHFVATLLAEAREPKKTTTSPERPNISKPFIISDIGSDERFKMKTFSARQSRLAFYAGVPITTASGFIIGVFSIIDDAPRGGLDPAEEAFLIDLSASIMEHLETIKIKQQQHRAEGMVKGIGLFVEGKSSLRDWWLHTGHESRGRQARNGTRGGLTLLQQADEEFGINHDRAPTPKVEAKAFKDLQSALEVKRVVSLGRPSPPTRSETWQSSSSEISSKVASLTFPSAAEESAITSMESISCHETPGVEDNFETPRNILDYNGGFNEKKLEPSSTAKEIEVIFARASNLIREATAAEGVLFLDVGFGNFEGSTSDGNVRKKAPGSFNGDSEHTTTTSSSEEELRKAGLLRSAAAAGRNNDQDVTPAKVARDPSKNCNIFGWSTRSHSSLHGHQPAKEHTSVSEMFLQKLLKRYPHGKIFNFDEKGTMSSSDENHSANSNSASNDRGSQRGKRRETKQLRRKIEAETILSIFPGSRSVAFMPLWDPHREKWYSGGFSWSVLPTRVFDVEEDLTYLAAFGNSIMAEVSRTNALIADQRKSDLISSISHELRSPLHGVLASIEILKDTNMDPLQDNMVAAIDTCGRTLLDVINHVLDFTSMNSVAKSERVTRKKARDSHTGQSVEQQKTVALNSIPKAKVNLSVLTEEVVESIIAGRRYDSKHAGSLDRDSGMTAMQSEDDKATSTTSQSTHDPVMVILDFDWQQSWATEIQPGAWRRIVMNLVANAMKYTDSGYVCISLRGSEIAATSVKGPLSQVVLSVSDSGKGISQEFLDNRIFQPFSQEDELTNGVGLGLSIIHKIVHSLGGSIDFVSELGSGTEATVTMTFDKSKSTNLEALSHREQVIFNVRTQHRRKKACLVAFDIFPNMSEVPTGILSMEAERMMALKSSLVRLLVDWFDMEVVFSPLPSGIEADLYVTTESEYNTWPSTTAGNMLPGSRGGAPLIVIGSIAASTVRSTCSSEQSIIFIQEPCGPYKLAKALAHCFNPTGPAIEATPIAQSGPVELDRKFPSSPTTGGGRGSGEASAQTVVSIPIRPKITRTRSAESGTGSRRRSSYNWNLTSPAVMTPMSPMSPVTTPGEEQVNMQPRILLVEDNDINLKILVAFVRKLKYSFATAENGLVALEAYKAANPRFDLILMDISMPVMDGLMSTRLIRTHERASKMVPATIIALTAAATESSRQEAFDCGVDIFLTKPVPLKELKGIVGGWKEAR